MRCDAMRPVRHNTKSLSVLMSVVKRQQPGSFMAFAARASVDMNFERVAAFVKAKHPGALPLDNMVKVHVNTEGFADGELTDREALTDLVEALDRATENNSENTSRFPERFKRKSEPSKTVNERKKPKVVTADSAEAATAALPDKAEATFWAVCRKGDKHDSAAMRARATNFKGTLRTMGHRGAVVLLQPRSTGSNGSITFAKKIYAGASPLSVVEQAEIEVIEAGMLAFMQNGDGKIAYTSVSIKLEHVDAAFLNSDLVLGSDTCIVESADGDHMAKMQIEPGLQELARSKVYKRLAAFEYAGKTNIVMFVDSVDCQRAYTPTFRSLMLGGSNFGKEELALMGQ